LAALITGFATGAKDNLTKPFMQAQLSARLKTHLNLFKISRFGLFEFMKKLGAIVLSSKAIGYSQLL